MPIDHKYVPNLSRVPDSYKEQIKQVETTIRLEDEESTRNNFNFVSTDYFFRNGYLVMGNDSAKYQKLTPKQIIEWEMRHKNYRDALTNEKSPNLIKLAKLYGAEFPDPIRKSTMK